MRYKERSGTVVGMPGASRISNDDLLTMKCDILIPAALENVITLNNAEQIKAKIVAEAANGPPRRTPTKFSREEASRASRYSRQCRRRHRQLLRMGAGFAGFLLVGSRSERQTRVVMRRAFIEVSRDDAKHRTHMRTGAYVLAVGRVADATLVRGLFP